MKYLLIMQINPEVIENLSEEDQKTIQDGHQAFLKQIQESGEMIGTQALSDPSNTKVVASRGGAPAVTDGPYLETKEFMGGYYLVDVDSEDRAVELARQIPDTTIDGLAVEVRPVMFSAGFDV